MRGAPKPRGVLGGEGERGFVVAGGYILGYAVYIDIMKIVFVGLSLSFGGMIPCVPPLPKGSNSACGADSELALYSLFYVSLSSYPSSHKVNLATEVHARVARESLLVMLSPKSLLARFWLGEEVKPNQS